MNALHLLWIIPLSVCVGFFWAAMLAVSNLDDNYFERDEGYGTVTPERITDIKRDD